MSKILIDGREIECLPGEKLIDAARRNGIPVPSLCHLPGRPPHLSCLACVMLDKHTGKMLPSCSGVPADGGEYESECEAVYFARKTSLELLAGRHEGPCTSACERACPAGLDIPGFFRRVQGGQRDEALSRMRDEMLLPGFCAELCDAPCEKACIRNRDDAGGSVSIQSCIRDILKDARPGESRTSNEDGKRVAVVGAGVTGLAICDALSREGLRVELFDREKHPENQFDDDRLRRVYLREADRLMSQGVTFEFGVEINELRRPDELLSVRDAVVLATLEHDDWELRRVAGSWGVFAVRAPSREGYSGLLASANRSVKDVLEHLKAPSKRTQKRFNARAVREEPGELQKRCEGVGPEHAVGDGGEADALRCLLCGCQIKEDCSLRDSCTRYQVSASRFADDEYPAACDRDTHPDIRWIPSKCIACGICVTLSREANEKVGLAMTGRSAFAHAAPPSGYRIREALTVSAREASRLCPSGALIFRRRES